MCYFCGNYCTSMKYGDLIKYNCSFCGIYAVNSQFAQILNQKEKTKISFLLAEKNLMASPVKYLFSNTNNWILIGFQLISFHKFLSNYPCSLQVLINRGLLNINNLISSSAVLTLGEDKY